MVGSFYGSSVYFKMPMLVPVLPLNLRYPLFLPINPVNVRRIIQSTRVPSNGAIILIRVVESPLRLEVELFIHHSAPPQPLVFQEACSAVITVIHRSIPPYSSIIKGSTRMPFLHPRIWQKKQTPFLHPPGSQPDSVCNLDRHQFFIKLTVEEPLPTGETAPRCCTCTTLRPSVPPRFVPAGRFTIRHGGRKSSQMIGVCPISEVGGGGRLFADCFSSRWPWIGRYSAVASILYCACSGETAGGWSCFGRLGNWLLW